MKRVAISSSDRRQIDADRDDLGTGAWAATRGPAQTSDEADRSRAPSESIDLRLAAWETDGGRVVSPEPAAARPGDAAHG